jgi:thymidylate synthase
MASPHPEDAYLDLLTRILSKGAVEQNRTGVSCMVLFGDQIRFPIGNVFPVLTTKKVFWRGIVEELLWFLRGDTDNGSLKAKGVHIWDSNSSREALDAHGLQKYCVDDCGPIYSFQWTHYGAKYEDCKTDYRNQGVNQINYIIKELKENPQSRRILMSAWNPVDLDAMCLPPCHTSAQFHVRDGKYLACHMYQRSCDTFLGLPFNIASYALLTHLIAAKTDLLPDELIISFGNVHIYENQTEAVKEQVARTPLAWPALTLDDPSTWEMDTITFEQIHLQNYKSHDAIKVPMIL